MLKADYKSIASYYDKGRSLSEQNIVLWLDLIAKLSGLKKGLKVLDLGCGTGRFSIPMNDILGCDVIGADYSIDMLDKAMQKDIDSRVNWICMNAENLNFHECSFDAVFMSHLLHHVDNPQTVLEQCYKIVVPAGAVLIRYGSMDQIWDDVEHTFFPGALEIDESRTLTRELIEEWLLAAGFRTVYSEEVVQKTYQTGMEHLRAAVNRSTSVLSMISEESLSIGLNRLKKYIEKNPDDEWLLYDRMTITAAYS